MLQAQKEAEEEDKEIMGVLTDTHIMMGTRDLFGGECRVQWLRGRVSDSRLREPGFESWLWC